MMLFGGDETGSRAQICIEAPRSDRLRRAFEPGKAVRLMLAGKVDELTMRDGHADLRLDVNDLAVRPDGRRTISNLIEDKQRKAVR